MTGAPAGTNSQVKGLCHVKNKQRNTHIKNRDRLLDKVKKNFFIILEKQLKEVNKCIAIVPSGQGGRDNCLAEKKTTRGHLSYIHFKIDFYICKYLQITLKCQ